MEVFIKIPYFEYKTQHEPAPSESFEEYMYHLSDPNGDTKAAFRKTYGTIGQLHESGLLDPNIWELFPIQEGTVVVAKSVLAMQNRLSDIYPWVDHSWDAGQAIELLQDYLIIYNHFREWHDFIFENTLWQLESNERKVVSSLVDTLPPYRRTLHKKSLLLLLPFHKDDRYIWQDIVGVTDEELAEIDPWTKAESLGILLSSEIDQNHDLFSFIFEMVKEGKSPNPQAHGHYLAKHEGSHWKTDRMFNKLLFLDTAFLSEGTTILLANSGKEFLPSRIGFQELIDHPCLKQFDKNTELTDEEIQEEISNYISHASYVGAPKLWKALFDLLKERMLQEYSEYPDEAVYVSLFATMLSVGVTMYNELQDSEPVFHKKNESLQECIRVMEMEDERIATFINRVIDKTGFTTSQVEALYNSYNPAFTG